MQAQLRIQQIYFNFNFDNHNYAGNIPDSEIQLFFWGGGAGFENGRPSLILFLRLALKLMAVLRIMFREIVITIIDMK